MGKLIIEILVLFCFLPASQDPCFIESKICYFYFQGLGNCGMRQMPGSCCAGVVIACLYNLHDRVRNLGGSQKNSAKIISNQCFCLLFM